MTDQTSSGRPPMPDYDALSVGDIAHRARSLSAPDVERLMEYERGHAARTPVLEVLSARLAQLEAGHEPSPGGAPPPPPEGTRSGSPVGPDTAGEPVHPPPHGTPQQFGRPKGDQRP
jgi:hypothetical protein